MTTAESLLYALKEDDLQYLTPGSYVDYGFDNITEKNASYLFGAYHAIAKFMTDEQFIKTMHKAYIDENLHEIVDELTKKLPELFQNHWKNFLANNGKISPIYI
jgi:mannose/cellobiose epimerase-like protein (N-acyl-D-glucosamine 2-epimerase family)